jgi:predicted site-specific integrase-resolvase
VNGQVVRADLLTATDIEVEYGVKTSMLRSWRHRGRLRPVCYTRGREHAALYRRGDVERAAGPVARVPSMAGYNTDADG